MPIGDADSDIWKGLRRDGLEWMAGEDERKTSGAPELRNSRATGRGVGEVDRRRDGLSERKKLEKRVRRRVGWACETEEVVGM